MCGVVAEPGKLAPDGIPNRERTMRDDRLLRHGMRRGGDGEGHALGQPRPDLIEHGAKASALAEGLPRPMRSGRQVRGRCGHARFSGGQLPGMTSRRWTAAPETGAAGCSNPKSGTVCARTGGPVAGPTSVRCGASGCFTLTARHTGRRRTTGAISQFRLPSGSTPELRGRRPWVPQRWTRLRATGPECGMKGYRSISP